LFGSREVQCCNVNKTSENTYKQNIEKDIAYFGIVKKKAPAADMKSAIALALLCKTPAFTACVPDESSLY